MATCVNEYPECTAAGRHLEPICLLVKQLQKGTKGSWHRQEQSLEESLPGEGERCCLGAAGPPLGYQGHLWDTTFRGRGSAFAQPRFEVSQSAEGVVGAPCCRDGDAAAPVSPAARSSFGLKPCLWGWALCRERGCSHARAKWVTATPGWQPAAPGEAAQDGLRGREGAKQPLGIQRGGSERR